MDPGIPSTKDSDIGEVERAFRELQAELNMTRHEVDNLKSQLKEVCHENNNLQYSLENEKKTSERNKIILEMYRKNTQDFQRKYYAKRDELYKLELHYKTETLKAHTLKEELQKIAIEKLQLVRNSFDLANKVKVDSIYRNDMTPNVGAVRSAVTILKKDIQEGKEWQQRVATLVESIDIVEESARKCQEFSNRMEKINIENKDLEEKYIKYKAKAETLETSLSANIRSPDDVNLEAQVILRQYKKAKAYYKEVLQIKAEIITTLNANLCKERDTKLMLLNESETKSKHIMAIETKLNHYEAQKCGKESEQLQEICDLSVVKMENEIIMIDEED